MAWTKENGDLNGNGCVCVCVGGGGGVPIATPLSHSVLQCTPDIVATFIVAIRIYM